jgi:hypothetical protein
MVDMFAPSTCQQQMLQLLGLAPELLGWDAKSSGFLEVLTHLHFAVWLCLQWCAVQPCPSSQGDPEQQLQRWQFEQRLWQLLPTWVMPCASDLVSGSAQGLLQQHQEQPQQLLQEQLLQLSNRSLAACDQVYKQLCTLGAPPAPPTAAWVTEFVGKLLQLADKLLLQQPPAPAAAAWFALTGGSSSSSHAVTTEARVACAEQLVQLLYELPHMNSRYKCTSGTGDLTTHGSSANLPGELRSSFSSVSVPRVAKRIVKFATALEAALRSVAVAVESGNVSIAGTCGFNRSCFVASWLVQHLGIRGPAGLVQEQRQLYSLLGTMLKLGCYAKARAQPSGGDPLAQRWQAAGSGCCLAAGQAAVWLLQVSLSTGGSAYPESLVLSLTEAQCRSVAAAAALQPSEAYLPSLVIFGRCCLQWAQQLQQQAPELLLLRLGGSEQEEQQRREVELHASYNAALLCVPGLRSWAGNSPCGMLESLAASVSDWVGSIEATAALAQLEAAGCAPQQLQHRLQALLSAQQGTQQGVTDTSLAALVRQLQKTGSRLSNIAVRHFCNNLACVNLNGPTEVRLVSGRGCMCAGCRMARYCGRDCQRAAWKQHKPVCKALAAAGVVAATAATASTTTTAVE